MREGENDGVSCHFVHVHVHVLQLILYISFGETFTRTQKREKMRSWTYFEKKPFVRQVKNS